MPEHDYRHREKATRKEWAVMLTGVAIFYGLIYLGIAYILGWWPW